jgi:hypothetical protein
MLSCRVERVGDDMYELDNDTTAMFRGVGNFILGGVKLLIVTVTCIVFLASSLAGLGQISNSIQDKNTPTHTSLN